MAEAHGKRTERVAYPQSWATNASIGVWGPIIPYRSGVN
jgi:hypothetical protein